MTEGIIPYGNTGSGWSGSETSRERQEREDSAGITGKRQAEVYGLLATHTTAGMTVKEVEDIGVDVYVLARRREHLVGVAVGPYRLVQHDQFVVRRYPILRGD